MTRRFFGIFLGAIGLAAAQVGDEAHAQDTPPPTVAVYNFKDPKGSGEAATLKEMVTTAIISMGKFTVISRDLDSADAEQALRAAGKTGTGRGGAKPKAATFDFSIEGSITSVQGSTQVDNTAAGVDIPILGKIGGCAKQVVSISVDVVIKNINTQETPYAGALTRREETNCNRSGKQVDVPFLMRSIANQLARDFSLKIYPITVIAVQPDGSMVFDYGSSVLPAGTFVNVYGPGQEIYSKGKMLTAEGLLLGRVQITNANAETARGVFEGTPAGQAVVGATGTIDPNQEPARRSRGRR